jgi:hypothetical protein
MSGDGVQREREREKGGGHETPPHQASLCLLVQPAHQILHVVIHVDAVAIDLDGRLNVTACTHEEEMITTRRRDMLG